MTLLEVMVATAIAAVALIAMLRLFGQAAAIEPQLQERYLAGLVAENVLVELELAPPVGSLQQLSGNSEMGHLSFSWQTPLIATSQRGIRRIEIAVTRDGEEKVLAQLTGFIPDA